MTIVEFLTARYDEEESGIREALRTGDYGVSERDLADIAAKRRIVELWEYRWQEANDAIEQEMNAMYASQATGLGNAVRLLAAVYSDHPDYDPDWKF